jgi:hypothetical protein
MNEDEPFLSRWSRRKRHAETAQADRKATDKRAPGEHEGGAKAAPEVRETATTSKPQSTEPLDLSKLPKVEELTADSDFTQFMDARVPSGLRQAALRRAWALDPRIRDFIEIAEWQYDWNVPGGAPGYGPLPEGANVASLLAQVIGAIPTASASEKADGRTLGDKLSQSEQQPVPLAASDAGRAPDTAGARVEPETDDKSARARNAVDGEADRHTAVGAGDERSVASPDAVPAGRRRHGGALPV